ncbi:MAG: sulfotransferase family protein, partial [Alphaproteobacteria bacterium]
MTQEPRAASKAEQLHGQAVQALSAGKLDEGMALLKKALDNAGSDIARSIILNDLGTAYWQRGQAAMAEKHYAKAAQLAPQNARAVGNYGAFLVEQGRVKEGEPHIRKALADMPDHYKIQNDAGRLAHKKGNLAAAEKFFLESIRLNPSWTNAHINLGDLLTDMGRYAEAEKALQEALKLNPQNAVALNALGKVYTRQKQDEDALECFDDALERNPTLDSAWGRKLNLLERMQRLDEAAATLEKARAACPDSARIIVFAAKLLRRQGKEGEALRLLEKMRPKLKADERLDQSFMWGFFFELGELYDRAGEADKAFECFAKANAGEAAGAQAQALDKGALLRSIEKLREGFTPELAKKPGVVPGGKQTPVFLIGFPRSGTTLLDQILSSHPDIRVADEKPAIDKIAEFVTGIHGPAALGTTPLAGLADFSAAKAEELRKLYFAEHGVTAGAGIFIDKLPLNIIHAGFIKRVFPDAKFILALRHPCDTVLSCFMQRFELNPAMAQFLSLEDAARFYDAVFGLWDHYTKTMPMDVHTIRYEDVVSDFRPTVAALLEFLGVFWNDAVLEYDKTAREKPRINTPSYHQVTQKIYT